MGTRLTDVQNVILSVADGQISANDFATVKWNLVEAGVDSLMFLSLIEALEADFGIIIEPTESPDFLQRAETIETFITKQLGE